MKKSDTFLQHLRRYLSVDFEFIKKKERERKRDQRLVRTQPDLALQVTRGSMRVIYWQKTVLLVHQFIVLERALAHHPGLPSHRKGVFQIQKDLNRRATPYAYFDRSHQLPPPCDLLCFRDLTITEFRIECCFLSYHIDTGARDQHPVLSR